MWRKLRRCYNLVRSFRGVDLWRRFHGIGTEMIITKAGRRMFPSLRVRLSGLDPDEQYLVAMDIVPVDNKRYRDPTYAISSFDVYTNQNLPSTYVYHSSRWTVAGTADIPPPSRVYVHPDSPAMGRAWTRQLVSFERVKLTNNETDAQGHLILHSMHRYQPRVHVLRSSAAPDPLPACLPVLPGLRTFCFPETVFTTVTAYQNQQITRLKIDRNPFAKGFRDSGRNRSGLDVLLESYVGWRSQGRSGWRSEGREPFDAGKELSHCERVEKERRPQGYFQCVSAHGAPLINQPASPPSLPPLPPASYGLLYTDFSAPCEHDMPYSAGHNFPSPCCIPKAPEIFPGVHQSHQAALPGIRSSDLTFLGRGPVTPTGPLMAEANCPSWDTTLGPEGVPAFGRPESPSSTLSAFLARSGGSIYDGVSCACIPTGSAFMLSG